MAENRFRKAVAIVGFQSGFYVSTIID